MVSEDVRESHPPHVIAFSESAYNGYITNSRSEITSKLATTKEDTEGFWPFY
jgi:hypothetical protein